MRAGVFQISGQKNLKAPCNKEKIMRGVKICLWIAGVACLLSGVGLVLPLSVIASWAGAFGIEEFPETPMMVYVMRAMRATFAAIGVFYIMLARRPDQYCAMTLFSGLAALFVGATCAVTGATTHMPLWYLGEALPCLLLGVLIIFFRRQAAICKS